MSSRIVLITGAGSGTGAGSATHTVVLGARRAAADASPSYSDGSSRVSRSAAGDGRPPAQRT